MTAFTGNTSGSNKLTENTPGSGIVMSAQGQGLLAALVNFMQPIIYASQALVPLVSADVDTLSIAHGTAGSNAGNGAEGRILLQSLENFIKAKILTDFPVEKETEHVPRDEVPSDQVNVATPQASTAVPSLAPSPSDFTSSMRMSILTTLRLHIFNKMPIRLLAFDSTGANLRLIERNEMFGQVLQRAFVGASHPHFDSHWREAEQLDRQDSLAKRESMIETLVEHHARYAILSHTWLRDTPGDVVYRDWDTRERNQRGYLKIAKFCEVAAREHGVTFGWMDTVCINKDSSSELDESIRSMYKWYRTAHVCVTYLAETQAVEHMQDDPWFTRGWTLQELLAPRDVQFYDMNWENMLNGNKGPVDESSIATHIREQIEEATSITEEELQLCRSGYTEKIPISRRLQLAAERQVTREEDTAYSLMGLLDVDISVAYGEGAERAFFRLMRELLNSKKHILDVFNHGYFLNLTTSKNRFIPSSIEQYKRRSSLFDVSGKGVASLLNQWQPLEPIIMTHLGVRVPLLLVPALNVTQSSSPISSEGFSAIGEFSGHILVHIWSEGRPFAAQYNLLDDRILEISPFTSTTRQYTLHAPYVATFGVLNFTIDNDDILIPRNCLSVPLDCGESQPGAVRPSDRIRILATHKAPVFQLESAENQNRISVDELEIHGMQLISLYLK